ncbi:phosphoribosylglycinamide formyltransferase [Sphingorhabdus sp. Alg239-R122]|uniref:phosphoribosylglycinamide formyltransferase n=1 Tax=Sphingorhabdus sp. Alg239-R122 TaxID=2305989 RepID=UPI0013DD6900|nr:phosphoribosylglycinamide formyltransferase [Sphingorhabdus sp. Alg239-R122]
MDKVQVAILISGKGTNMAALIYAAKQDDCPYEVALVASNNPKAEGLKLAEAEGIVTFAHSNKGMDRTAHDALMHAAILESDAEYVVLAGYMRILSEEFICKWRDKILNIHPSLLPKYKGLGTFQKALDAGDSHAGCSVHIVTPELDDGPVLTQTEVAIMDGDTPEALARRVQFAEHQLYPKTLVKYVTREQDPAWILKQVRTRALALPETYEKESFGAPGFRVGTEKTGKYFAYFSRDHFERKGVALFVKTTGHDEQAALLDADPDLYYSPKFYGASGWIAVRLDTGDTDWEHISDWLAKSWRIVAPKRFVKLQDIADEF